jgi:hypothetical protein
MTLIWVLLIIICAIAFTIWNVLDTMKYEQQMKELEREIIREQRQTPWWEAHRIVPREVVEEPKRPVYRYPADPIDAIDPANPTAPSLRDEYRLMIKNRG